MKVVYTVAVACIASISICDAQNLHFREHPFAEPYRHLRAEIILEDVDRNIWLGTVAGLFKFDGVDIFHLFQGQHLQ